MEVPDEVTKDEKEQLNKYVRCSIHFDFEWRNPGPVMESIILPLMTMSGA